MCLFNFHLFKQSVDGYAIIAEYQCPTMLCRLFITFSSINIQYNKICIINIILDNIRRIYKTCFCFIFLKLVLFHLDVFFCPHLSKDSHRLKWVFAHQIPDYSTTTCATVQLANLNFNSIVWSLSANIENCSRPTFDFFLFAIGHLFFLLAKVIWI